MTEVKTLIRGVIPEKTDKNGKVIEPRREYAYTAVTTAEVEFPTTRVNLKSKQKSESF